MVDEYFRKYAGQNEKRKTSATFVAVEDDEVLGYATVCPAELSVAELPASRGKGLPRSGTIPVLLLAMLGVDGRAQGIGLGRDLLARAMRQALLQSAELGCAGIVVDSRQDAAGFYRKLGFLTLESTARRPDVLRMFLPLSAIEDAIGLG